VVATAGDTPVVAEAGTGDMTADAVMAAMIVGTATVRQADIPPGTRSILREGGMILMLLRRGGGTATRVGRTELPRQGGPVRVMMTVVAGDPLWRTPRAGGRGKSIVVTGE
jgi:hypothetical protein